MKLKRKTAFICLGFLFYTVSISSPQASSDVLIKATLLQDSVRIGDDIMYKLNVSRPASVTLFYPTSQDTALGLFEIRNLNTVVKDSTDGVVTEEVSYTISIYDTGFQKLPPLTLFYINEEKESSMVVRNKGNFVYVQSVLDTSKKVIDIKDVKEVAFPIYLLLAALASLLLLGYACYLLYKGRSRFRPSKKIPSKPVISPYDQAYQGLKELEKMDLQSHSHFKSFYVIYSLVIRTFLERAYNVVALENVSYEIYESVKEKMPLEEQELLRKGLDFAELAKFAKYYPTYQDTRESLQIGFKIIERFKPQPKDEDKKEKLKA